MRKIAIADLFCYIRKRGLRPSKAAKKVVSIVFHSVGVDFYRKKSKKSQPGSQRQKGRILCYDDTF